MSSMYERTCEMAKKMQEETNKKLDVVAEKLDKNLESNSRVTSALETLSTNISSLVNALTRKNE